jgi:hypothetical protein
MLTVSTLDSSCGNIRDITSGLGLCNGNAASLLTCEQLWQEPLLQLGTTKFVDWGNSESEPGI